MHRAKTASRWQALLGGTAALAGHAVRLASAAASDAVGLIGAGLVAFGAGMIYRPLLPIVAGTFLLVIGRHLR